MDKKFLNLCQKNLQRKIKEPVVVTPQEIITENRSLLYIENVFLVHTLWKTLKTFDKRLYYLKIFQTLAEELNKSAPREKRKYFIHYNSFRGELEVFGHDSVKYNLVYFNTLTLAREAIKIMEEYIKYVV